MLLLSSGHTPSDGKILQFTEVNEERLGRARKTFLAARGARDLSRALQKVGEERDCMLAVLKKARRHFKH